MPSHSQDSAQPAKKDYREAMVHRDMQIIFPNFIYSSSPSIICSRTVSNPIWLHDANSATWRLYFGK